MKSILLAAVLFLVFAGFGFGDEYMVIHAPEPSAFEKSIDSIDPGISPMWSGYKRVFEKFKSLDAAIQYINKNGYRSPSLYAVKEIELDVEFIERKVTNIIYDVVYKAKKK